MLKVAEIEEAEKAKMKNKCKKIIDHGINCFINRQLIYNFPEQIFTDAGVVSIEHADFDGIERLAAVTGGEIASTFDRPDLVTIGECDLIDEITVGEDRLIRFSGCKGGRACSLILRGASSHLLDEAERSLHDALCVLSETVKETRVICGGGCTEMLMANAIDAQVNLLLTLDESCMLTALPLLSAASPSRWRPRRARPRSRWKPSVARCASCPPSSRTTAAWTAASSSPSFEPRTPTATARPA